MAVAWRLLLLLLCNRTTISSSHRKSKGCGTSPLSVPLKLAGRLALHLVQRLGIRLAIGSQVLPDGPGGLSGGLLEQLDRRVEGWCCSATASGPTWGMAALYA